MTPIFSKENLRKPLVGKFNAHHVQAKVNTCIIMVTDMSTNTDEIENVQAVWKYKIDFGALVGDELTIEMPAGAVVLTCQMQYGNPVLWVLVDPTAPLKPRVFGVYGTGNPIITKRPNFQDIATIRRIYVGSVQMYDGKLVWHIFEII
jgi:hypothetical protein